MSNALSEGRIPEWTIGDRLRKARALTGMTTREFAAQIGVSQKTVTDAENDKREHVRKILTNAWALASGVSIDWILTGQEEGHPDDGPGGEGVRREGIEPPTRWLTRSPSQSHLQLVAA